jgi:hypothetical protein
MDILVRDDQVILRKYRDQLHEGDMFNGIGDNRFAHACIYRVQRISRL